MEIISNIEPKAVMRFFEEICAIPHGSGDTKKISDYCVKFAKERKLRYIQDEFNNVIIFKDATIGYEAAQPIIIQGHMDMVCEKDADCAIDFEKNGLELIVENGYVAANGTTLGADDGIALAMAMAVLDSDEIPHPKLECVFTVDEEIGMLGAAAIDVSLLEGRKMLNIDSEAEGVLTVSCAGGADVIGEIPVVRKNVENKALVKIEIKGLVGGHSGMEIDKNRANSNILAGRILNKIKNSFDIGLVSLSGGQKRNAIPNYTKAEICTDIDNVETIKTIIDFYNTAFKKEYGKAEPDINVSMQYEKRKSLNAITPEGTRKIVFALVNSPNGVQAMSSAINGLVQTSDNLAIIELTENIMNLIFSVRSSVQTQKISIVERINSLISFLGGKTTVKGDYPPWEYKEKSKLRELMVEIYKEQYGEEPKIEAIHAGVECGLFSDKLEGLDCVSFGPDLLDIHTPRERMSIESVQRVWKYLITILKRSK